MGIKQELVSQIIAIKKERIIRRIEKEKETIEQKIASLQKEKAELESKIEAEKERLENEEKMLLKKTFSELGAILDRLEGNEQEEVEESFKEYEEPPVEPSPVPQETKTVENKPKPKPSPKPQPLSRRELLIKLREKLQKIGKDSPLYKEINKKAKELVIKEGVKKFTDLSEESLLKLLKIAGGQDV